MVKKRGSKIPAKAQMPLAGMLIVVFGAVLFWRFAPERDGAAAAVVEKGIAALVSMSDIQNLESLIEALEQNTLVRDNASSDQLSLKRDPFVKARAFSPGMIRREAEELELGDYFDEEMEELVDRDEFLEYAALTAVIMMGNRSVAVLDSKYLRTGDTVAGFTVTKIAADHIVLKDELGSELVRLEEHWRNTSEESGELSTFSMKDGEL